MKLSDISIQRPVFAVVMSLLLLVLGVMSFTRLTLRELPAIDPPIVSVSVDYTGASAAVIESRITQVLEDALAGIEGIDTINARSTNGRSQVSIEFTSNRDIEAAANDVRDAVSRVADRMPEEARPPEIAKVESDADPIIWFNMVSSTMDTLELSDYADRYVVDRFSSLDGVAQVRIGGRQRYAMRIWLDRDQLAARGLTTGDVETALRNENVELPAGRIESTDRDFTLRVDATPALYAAALAGMGISLFTALTVQEDLRAGRLIRVLPAWHAGQRRYFALYPHARALAPKVRALVEHLAAHYAAQAGVAG
ncbi:hypothetical protein C7E13_02045 [Stenotrophomonas maltophilia]|nr:hypothetical protein C7E13_02045 [Stenotrophomonas maltophilia]